MVEPDLKFNRHTNDFVCRANQRSSLYSTLFSSHKSIYHDPSFQNICPYTLLEYASFSWSPSAVGLIIHLKRVQRSFTKRLPGLNHLSYVERLSALNFHSLEHSRLITDLIILYKIIHKQICLNFSDFLIFSPCAKTRGHPYRITVPYHWQKKCIIINFFSCRIVPIWNARPNPVVLAPSVFAFKRLLIKTYLTKFLLFTSH